MEQSLMAGLRKAPHAVNPLAGPATHDGGGPGRVDREASGTPSTLGGFRNLDARSLWLLIPAVVLIAILGMFTGSANALETRPYTGVSFGPGGVSSGASFTGVESIAIEQAAGTVFVLDEGGSLYKFTAAGEPSDFESLGTNVLNVSALGGPGEKQVAVAPTGAAGGTAGDIYVAAFGGPVSVYSAAGVFLGTLGSPSACGVATDQNGDVYVGTYPSEVSEYEPSSNPPTDADLKTTSIAPLPEICNVGVGSAGEVYAANYAGEFGIVRLANVGSPTASQVDPTSRTLGVNLETGDLFADFEGGFRQYDATGALTLTAGTKRLSGSRGIAIRSGTDTLYVGNDADHKVDLFGPAEEKVAGAKIESSEVIRVNSSEATLGAIINPEGEATTFQVQYGPTIAYGSVTSSRPVGNDESPHRVTAVITGLVPGVTYHWRITAISSSTVTGPDRTFRTQHLPDATENTEACPNEIFRNGLAAILPDCRAYEMVTPIEKGGLDVQPSISLNGFYAQLDQAALSGDALTYTTSQGSTESKGGPVAQQYLAARSSVGWRNRPLAAPQGPSRLSGGERLDTEYRAFSADLCHGALLNFSEPPLTSGASAGAPNIYERNLCGGDELEGVTATPHEKRQEVGGITETGCVAYFESFQVGNGTANPSGAFENCQGTIHEVSIMPDGSSRNQAVIGSPQNSGSEELLRYAPERNAVSSDGSTVYWSAFGGGEEGLLVRINAQSDQSALGPLNECLEPTQGCTLQVSGLVESGSAEFGAASVDGTRAYFRRGSSLYEFSLLEHSVRLVAAGVNSLVPIIGASQDGSRVYFASTEVLDGAAIPGDENIYLYESGAPTGDQIHYVATLSDIPSQKLEEYAPTHAPYFQDARVDPDGRQIVFTTKLSLTGYDNRSVRTGEPAEEVYLYDAPKPGTPDRITCISCNPTGQQPETGRIPLLKEDALSENEFAATIPGFYTSLHGSNVLTAGGGRIFFESFDSLVPKDTNGKVDVYEWERNGVGTCSEQSASFSPANDGCLWLISSGTSPRDSHLTEVTPDGRDVFFTTAQSLVSEDPGLVDIYDARAGGGFPSASPPAQGCEGDACQNPPAPTLIEQAGSSRTTGTGNVRPKRPQKCGKHHRKRCAKSHKKHRKARKQSHRQGNGGSK